jgi:hypothetical protein
MLDEMIDALGDEKCASYELANEESYASKICKLLYNNWTVDELGNSQPLEKFLTVKLKPVEIVPSKTESVIPAQILICKLLEVRSKLEIVYMFFSVTLLATLR